MIYLSILCPQRIASIIKIFISSSVQGKASLSLQATKHFTLLTPKWAVKHAPELSHTHTDRSYILNGMEIESSLDMAVAQFA